MRMLPLALLLTFPIGAQQSVLREFVGLLRLPNVASDAANIDRNANAVLEMFGKRGVKTSLLTLDGAPPLVIGELPAQGATRTIAFYAHYDGQPVDPAQWKSAPFEPVMRDANGNAVDWENAV